MSRFGDEVARLLTIPPAVAAAQILRGIERRKARVLIGWSARLPDLLARLAPVGHRAILTAAYRPRR